MGRIICRPDFSSFVPYSYRIVEFAKNITIWMYANFFEFGIRNQKFLTSDATFQFDFYDKLPHTINTINLITIVIKLESIHIVKLI